MEMRDERHEAAHEEARKPLLLSSIVPATSAAKWCLIQNIHKNVVNKEVIKEVISQMCACVLVLQCFSYSLVNVHMLSLSVSIPYLSVSIASSFLVSWLYNPSRPYTGVLCTHTHKRCVCVQRQRERQRQKRCECVQRQRERDKRDVIVSKDRV